MYVLRTSLAPALRLAYNQSGGLRHSYAIPQNVRPKYDYCVEGWLGSWPSSEVLLWYTSMTSSNHQNRTCLPSFGNEVASQWWTPTRCHAHDTSWPDRRHLRVRAPPLRTCRPRSSIKKKRVSIQFCLLRCFLCSPRPLPLWTALLSSYIVPEPIFVGA